MSTLLGEIAIVIQSTLPFEPRIMRRKWAWRCFWRSHTWRTLFLLFLLALPLFTFLVLWRVFEFFKFLFFRVIHIIKVVVVQTIDCVIVVVITSMNGELSNRRCSRHSFNITHIKFDCSAKMRFNHHWRSILVVICVRCCFIMHIAVKQIITRFVFFCASAIFVSAAIAHNEKCVEKCYPQISPTYAYALGYRHACRRHCSTYLRGL
mmetsp:Transcript_12767/g.19378  ORF Transcript_12767/g.19378 Transcript_12767/m.19378 type:complete len:207 (+) Transcript_12767:1785-2405(+)